MGIMIHLVLPSVVSRSLARSAITSDVSYFLFQVITPQSHLLLSGIMNFDQEFFKLNRCAWRPGICGGLDGAYGVQLFR